MTIKCYLSICLSRSSLGYVTFVNATNRENTYKKLGQMARGQQSSLKLPEMKSKNVMCPVVTFISYVHHTS